MLQSTRAVVLPETGSVSLAIRALCDEMKRIDRSSLCVFWHLVGT